MLILKLILLSLLTDQLLHLITNFKLQLGLHLFQIILVLLFLPFLLCHFSFDFFFKLLQLDLLLQYSFWIDHLARC